MDMVRNSSIYLFLVITLGVIFSQNAFEGYTLFTPQTMGGNGATTYLIDNDENIIQSWWHTNGPASMPYLIPGEEPGLENTLLVYPYRVDNPTMDTGGTGGAFEVLTWDGHLVWEYTLSNEMYQHHHDIEPLPNGNILLIAWERKTAAEAYAKGREIINNPLNEMWSTAILEIAHDGNGGGEIVWEWHLWDHLIQDVDPNAENYGVVADHPELFNINVGDAGSSSAGPGGSNADWMHFNAIDHHVEWDQISICSRYQDEIFVIDHSTTTEEAASHSGGNSGKGGDFLYRWGNPQNYNRGDESNHILSNQHSINWIPTGFPGENNFILFNNVHNGNPAQGESAVLELTLPVDAMGNYFIEDGEPFGPDYISWIYEGEGFFSSFQSGSFRLPNGNTLITDADSAHIFEVTTEGEIVWEYTYSGTNIAIPRAQKYNIADFMILGDTNYDGSVNILDVVYIIALILDGNYIFAGDMNQDGSLNILDTVSLVNLILGT